MIDIAEYTKAAVAWADMLKREEERKMRVHLTYYNTERADDEIIDSETAKPTDQAEPTSRLLDGSADHGYVQEWAEPAILPDGRRCIRMYLFDEDDITDADGEEIEEAENFPWDEEHVRRIILID